MFGKEPEDDYTRELDDTVQAARKNEKWRMLDIRWMSAWHRPERSEEDYMTLQMHYQKSMNRDMMREIEKEQFL